MTEPANDASDRERNDLLETLTTHRGFLRYTARGLTEEQARARSTVSELTIGALLVHVTHTEATWADFVVRGAIAHGDVGPDADPTEVAAAWAEAWRMPEDRTLADVLDSYAQVAARTDELVRTVDLDADHALPTAPWFTPGARWSARRTFLHVVAETAQHAGHADIVREAIDGQKTMG